jgi:segregation and condensation protein B
MNMDTQEIKATIEALLFASPEPLTLDRICEVLEGIDPQSISATLSQLDREYQEPGRGFRMVRVAGGYQLATKLEYARWIKKLNILKKRSKLSLPSLETLAIIAYKQPITKPEIEEIRGVNVDGVIKTLLERGLIRIIGKKEMPGRPAIYGTTQEFLRHFGLNDLSELPEPDEFEEMVS